MKALLLAAACAVMSSAAFAEACWDEWEYKDQWLMRASQCAENVSIPDFAPMCQTRVQGDTPRRAAKCPPTVKSKEGLNVVTQPLAARCLGMAQPMSGGKTNL